MRRVCRGSFVCFGFLGGRVVVEVGVVWGVFRIDFDGRYSVVILFLLCRLWFFSGF